MHYMWVIYLVFQFTCPLCHHEYWSINEMGRYETKTEAYEWAIPLVNQRQQVICSYCNVVLMPYPNCATIQTNKAFFTEQGIPKPLVVTRKSKPLSQLTEERRKK
jgi:hypothetical protein